MSADAPKADEAGGIDRYGRVISIKVLKEVVAIASRK
jgi:hypothetical protein